MEYRRKQDLVNASLWYPAGFSRYRRGNDDYTCLFNTKGSKTNTVIRRGDRRPVIQTGPEPRLSFHDETTIPKIAIVAPKIRWDCFDPVGPTQANQRGRVIICFCPGRPSRYLSSHRLPQLQRCVTPNPLPGEIRAEEETCSPKKRGCWGLDPFREEARDIHAIGISIKNFT